MNEKTVRNHLSDPNHKGLRYRAEMEELIGLPEENWDNLPERGFRFRRDIEEQLNAPMEEWQTRSKGQLTKAYREVAKKCDVSIAQVRHEIEQTRRFVMSEDEAMKKVAERHGVDQGSVFVAIRESRVYIEKREGYYPVETVIGYRDSTGQEAITRVQHPSKIEWSTPEKPD